MTKFALLTAAAVAAAAAVVAPASAQDITNGNAYANLGYTQFNTARGDLGGVTGRLGYRFTPYVSAEGEYTAGVNDSHEGKLSNAWGLYGRVGVPVSPNFDVFGRAGYQEINIDGRNGFSNRDGQGLGYGAGVQWRPTAASFGIRGEYTRLTDADA
ncbi:MAG: outer membrane beta-barrel protein, partial [Proteobacteria bacterium]|nr:outer membrane beta-barrel protein [Pseudomonadota bacterium]